MNRVNNWAILSTFFFLLTFALMFIGVPMNYVWAPAALCLVSIAMLLIRYEDYHKAHHVSC